MATRAILTIIDRNPKLQPSTKKQYKKAIRDCLDTGNHLFNDKLTVAVEEWHALVDDGYIARSITKGGAIGESISAIGNIRLVNEAEQIIDKPALAPHDLRWTYAQLGDEAGGLNYANN